LVPTQPDDLRLFGKAYRDNIRSSRNITTYLYANVTNIQQSTDGRIVTNVVIHTISGSKWSVSARIFILATGGIENARLLLLSNGTQSTGIGNAYDLVGRYFMAHLELEAGIFIPSAGTSMQYFHAGTEAPPNRNGKCGTRTINWGGETFPILTLSEELRQQYKLLNFTAEVEAFKPPLPSGVESLHELAQSVRDHRIPNDLITHLGRILAESGDVAAAIYGKMRGEEPKVMEAYRLTNASETVPNPNSRVTLSTETDQFNCNRVVLNWALSPMDTDSLQRGYEIIGQELGRSGLGRLKISIETQFGSAISQDGGPYWSQHHHMGTTRMHVDPKKGVVNANCQIHGVSNLFIAGSSVFPTSSSATPTLTIIALAVRLADHIKGKMR
jgi:choline dehydrogenase-like flavoprotein